MKLAVISDLHADLHALRDALVQIDAMGCDLIVCAGDIMDDGVFPEETIALLVERRIPTIRGNHDRWALRENRDASGWDLSETALGFLRGLPLSWSATLSGVRVAMHHARPVENDMEGLYVDMLTEEKTTALLDAAKADVLLVGHTHDPMAVRTAAYRPRDGRLIANPGTLSRAERKSAMVFDRVSGTFAAMKLPSGVFGVLHLPEKRFVVHSAADGSVVFEG